MTGKNKVHGLTGEWVEPDWPFLTVTEVDRLLQHFSAARGADRVLTYSPRPFSAASVVATPRGTVFVKRHHESVRNREELLEEHRFIKHLRAHGAHVPEVLADDDGETAIRAGAWTYEVHALADGLDLYQEALSWAPFRSTLQAQAAGRALAQLHLAAEGYEAAPRKAKTLVTSFSIFASQDPLPALERYVAERPLLERYLSERDWLAQTDANLMSYHRRLSPWLGALKPLWTHNDLHASNLMWSSAKDDATAVSAIDFGLSDRTNAVHDIATAIERNCVEWLALSDDFRSVARVEQIDALLAGYERVRPLTAPEARAVPAILPLVHAEFALSEAEYFLRVQRSEERTSLAWNGYFLGHAAWFRRAAGMQLLDHLEAWADRRQSVAMSVASE